MYVVQPYLGSVLTTGWNRFIRIYMSKIWLCDWPNELDTTSRQVLNTTESIGYTDSNSLFCHLIESVHGYFVSLLRRLCRAK